MLWLYLGWWSNLSFTDWLPLSINWNEENVNSYKNRTSHVKYFILYHTALLCFVWYLFAYTFKFACTLILHKYAKWSSWLFAQYVNIFIYIKMFYFDKFYFLNVLFLPLCEKWCFIIILKCNILLMPIPLLRCFLLEMGKQKPH